VFCGREALSAVERDRFDLILLDLKLPDMGGIELLERLKEVSPSSAVIVLTGHATIDTAVRAMNQGAYSYLEKPCKAERLFLVIERALAHTAQGRSDVKTEELAELLSQSEIPVFTFDTGSGAVTRQNDAFRSLLRGKSGVPSLLLAQLFTEPALLAGHLEEIKAKGRACAEIPAPDGKGRRFRILSYHLSGRSREALSLLLDVTPGYQSEVESNRLRQYFEAIFAELAAGVMIVDSNYVIRQVNPAFARLYQTDPDSIARRKCHELIHRRQTPCHLHGEVCPIKSCLATGTTCRVQHRHFDASGQLHFIESTMTPLRDENGTIVSFVEIFADFTEIKHAQEESEAKSRELARLNKEQTGQREQIAAQADELKKTNLELINLSAAKSDFVSMVSHELRTPLTAINEGINLVADQTLGPVSPTQVKFLNLALTNARRLGDLINDLLDLSKIEAGRVEVRPVPLDLAAVLSEAGATFTPAAQQKGLNIEIRSECTPLRVLADERMARRVLNNLLNNSLKFTDRGGITIEARPAGEEARVTVTDTGIGIPEDEQPGMFEKFHQVHHKDGRRPAGTGLGLALTKEMVEMNAGRIWFESKPGLGTSFSFTLPADTSGARIRVLLASSRRQAKSQARALLLVRIQCGEMERSAEDAGAVLDAIAQRLVESQSPCPDSQPLPDDCELLLLLAGSPSEIETQARRVRDVLAGATFVVRKRVIEPRLSVGYCMLDDTRQPAALLEKLRRELHDVKPPKTADSAR
jgi:PAS domain S-box-containing protein